MTRATESLPTLLLLAAIVLGFLALLALIVTVLLWPAARADEREDEELRELERMYERPACEPRRVLR